MRTEDDDDISQMCGKPWPDRAPTRQVFTEDTDTDMDTHMDMDMEYAKCQPMDERTE